MNWKTTSPLRKTAPTEEGRMEKRMRMPPLDYVAPERDDLSRDLDAAFSRYEEGNAPLDPSAIYTPDDFLRDRLKDPDEGKPFDAVGLIIGMVIGTIIMVPLTVLVILLIRAVRSLI